MKAWHIGGAIVAAVSVILWSLGVPGWWLVLIVGTGIILIVSPLIDTADWQPRALRWKPKRWSWGLFLPPFFFTRRGDDQDRR